MRPTLRVSYPNGMRRALLALGAGLIGLAGVLVVRALYLTPSTEGLPPSARGPVVDGALERLAGGLRHRTVSPQDVGERDAAAFLGFHRYLESAFPRAHEQLEREVVAGLSLLYRWKGTQPDLDPLLLLAHQDVVPVEPGTEAAWEEPPFGGDVRDGFLWGRGALDDKLSLFATLEAVEWLLERGHQPRRSVLLAFGHDEELGGPEGAAGIAERLRAGGIRPFLVLDEGGSVARGIVPLLERDVAVIGIAEKGYVSVELTVETEGGHSSTPRGESSIGILARAVSRLEGSPPAPRLDDSMRAFFAHIAPEAPFAPRLVLANLWLFEPLLVRVLAGIPETAPAVRTTTAPTILRAGLKDNVLPSRATAVVNFRILPGESIESVLAHVARAVDDSRVVLAPLPKRREPSLASRLDSEAYALLARTIREVFPDVVVAPYLMVAGTDSRHFRPLTENVYRFLPARLDSAAVAGIHGTNERVALGALDTAVAFYVRLIRNAAG